jgi:SAM-dependent methyltransferase
MRVKKILKSVLGAGKGGDRQADLALPPSERIRKWGHRAYIGGTDSENWYHIGLRQYHFLVSNGLKPEHKFLDVACGALRLGQFLIPMLDEGNYYGIDGEGELINAGLSKELMFDLHLLKEPKFAVNYEFDVSFCGGYDFAIAQSLFTHLTAADIAKCFEGVAKAANPGSKFFFTFFEGSEQKNVHDVSHANKQWFYSFDTLKELAETNGFDCDYIGDWGHERRQMMGVAHKR